MDGSAQHFVELIDQVGLASAGAPRASSRSRPPIEVRDGGKRAALVPASHFEVDFEIEFSSAAIGRQRVITAADAAGFRRELAWARTFGFTHEVEALRAAGLARGGSLENAVVIEATRAEPRKVSEAPTSSSATRRWTRSVTSMCWARPSWGGSNRAAAATA
jgi:UDP-3-O-[3-hydroxymyristoyl] N-acetylglucosamine deacetylase